MWKFSGLCYGELLLDYWRILLISFMAHWLTTSSVEISTTVWDHPPAPAIAATNIVMDTAGRIIHSIVVGTAIALKFFEAHSGDVTQRALFKGKRFAMMRPYAPVIPKGSFIISTYQLDSTSPLKVWHHTLPGQEVLEHVRTTEEL